MNLEGSVPEKLITGDTDNSSITAYHVWYHWIKFYYLVSKQFPEENMYLGRYLGPAIDIGPTPTGKISKSNGEVVHISTYLSLITEEVNYEKELRCLFDVVIEENLGPKAVSKDFGEMVLEENTTFKKY